MQWGCRSYQCSEGCRRGVGVLCMYFSCTGHIVTVVGIGHQIQKQLITGYVNNK